jgi:hypothetical protein
VIPDNLAEELTPEEIAQEENTPLTVKDVQTAVAYARRYCEINCFEFGAIT